MTVKDAQHGLLKGSMDISTDELMAKIVDKHPIELDDKIKTLDKPLLIECASPGWQPRTWPDKTAYPIKLPPNYKEGGIRFPAVPCTIEDQVNEIIKASQAGCIAAHIHPRDPNDCMATKDSKLLGKVYDLIFSEVDVISIQHTWKIKDDGTIDYIDDAKELLSMGKGNKYCQGAVVMWPPANSYPSGYTKSVQEAVRFMEDNNIKPIHKLRGTYHVRQMKRTLIDTGIMKNEPFVLVHDMGHPFGWPLDIDPWMPIDLIASIMQTKERIPGSIIGVFSGGRNWLPITITAILAGVDFVRVGIEDCYWMYPHKDEVIRKNIDCVNKIIEFCQTIGRRLAKVGEAREILNFSRTS